MWCSWCSELFDFVKLKPYPLIRLHSLFPFVSCQPPSVSISEFEFLRYTSSIHIPLFSRYYDSPKLFRLSKNKLVTQSSFWGVTVLKFKKVSVCVWCGPVHKISLLNFRISWGQSSDSPWLDNFENGKELGKKDSLSW